MRWWDRLLFTITKQWPLDSEFIKFEYSPEIHHFWRIRVLAKMALFENRSDSPDSSTFANLVCSDSPDSSTFANLFCSDSPYSPVQVNLVNVCSMLSPANFASFCELYIIYQVGQIKQKSSRSKNCNKTFCQASESNEKLD